MSWEGKGSCFLVGVKGKGGEGGSSWRGTSGQRSKRDGAPQGWGARAGNGVVRLDGNGVEGSLGHSS